MLERGARALALGGDHTVSYPLLRAYGAAHPDLYDELDGGRLSHTCP